MQVVASSAQNKGISHLSSNFVLVFSKKTPETQYFKKYFFNSFTLFFFTFIFQKMADTTEVKKPTEPVLDISDSNVQAKYKEAGRIADGKKKYAFFFLNWFY